MFCVSFVFTQITLCTLFLPTAAFIGDSTGVNVNYALFCHFYLIFL